MLLEMKLLDLMLDLLLDLLEEELLEGVVLKVLVLRVDRIEMEMLLLIDLQDEVLMLLDLLKEDVLLLDLIDPIDPTLQGLDKVKQQPVL